MPEPKIIVIAPSLNLRNKNKPTMNRIASIGLKSASVIFISLANNARVRIDKPAQLIKATTAGRREDNTVFTPEKLRYL